MIENAAEIAWQIAAVRDLIRENDASLWRDVRFASMEQTADAIRNHYGFSIHSRSMSDGLRMLLDHYGASGRRSRRLRRGVRYGLWRRDRS